MTSPKRATPKQRPWQQGGETESVSFGSWLRRQREVREISLREIADSSKISLRYLEALEGDRFDLLPAPVFARGFLREYAKFVGLSPDDVVNYFLVAQQALEPSEDEDEGAPVAPREGTGAWTWGLLILLASLVVLGLVALLAYHAERRREASHVEAPPTTAPPMAAAAAAPPAATGLPAPGPGEGQPASRPGSQAPLRVTLDFTGQCWVDLLIDGSRRVSELRVQGESLPIEAQQSVVLTLGDAGAVRVDVNGHPYDIAGGGPGKVVRDLRIDLDTVKALVQGPT